MAKKSTEVATRNAGVPDLAGMARGLRSTRAKMPATGGGKYMKFGNDGIWSIGKNGDALNGEIAILNVNTLKSGFICWTDYPKKEKKKNEKLGEEMELITRGGVDYDELDDHSPWDWKTQMGIDGRLRDGDRTQFTYNTSSNGGLDLIGDLIDRVMERVDAGETVYLFPVVALNTDHYEHGQYGKTYTPEFEFIGWSDIEGNMEGEEPDEEPEEKPAPKKRKAKKADPEPEPEEGDEDDEDDDEPEAEEPEEEEEDEPEAEEPPRRRRRR